MTIIEAIKLDDANLRISNNNRWLVWDVFKKMWIVYERKKYQKVITIVIETESEEEAVKELLK